MIHNLGYAPHSSPTLLQIILVPGLIVVFIALITIIIVLLVQLQRLRSSQRSPQSAYPNRLNSPSMGGVADYPLPQLLQQPPQVIYANSVPRPIVSEHREEQITLASQAKVSESPSSPQLVPSNRDSLMNDERWLKLVEECVALFDDLDSRLASFDPSRQALVEHVLLQLQEILERSGVELIVNDTTFERRRHQPDQPASGAVPGTPIIATLSPGFALGRRVLRRARVRLAQVSS